MSEIWFLLFFGVPLQCNREKWLLIRNKDYGALDEWLSQRSAKPCTAVRIRQAPQVVDWREWFS